MFAQPHWGRAWGGCPKPRRRGWLRSNRRMPSCDAEPVRISGAPGGFCRAGIHCFGEISELRLWAQKKRAFEIVFSAPLSVSEGLPQRWTRAIKETLHPTTSTSNIVIFANRLTRRWRHCDFPHAALVDRNVAAFITCLQLTVEAEFHAQPLTTHAGLYFGALDLISPACVVSGCAWNS